MGVIERTISSVMRVMTREEKLRLVFWAVDKMLKDMSAADKQALMLEMMPGMIQGINMGDLMPKIMATIMGCEKQDGSGLMGITSKMIGHGDVMETSMMVLMMMEMIPQDIKVMLPHMPKEKRMDFAARLVAILMEEGRADLSDEEKDEFTARLRHWIEPGR